MRGVAGSAPTRYSAGLRCSSFQVLGLHLARAAVHQARGGGGLGEGDGVADVVAPGHEHDDAVEAQPDAAVRRRGVAVGLEQEAELGVRLLAGEPHHVHDALLDVGPVDAHRTRAQLGPVQDQVVEQGVDVARVFSRNARCSGRGMVNMWWRGPSDPPARPTRRAGSRGPRGSATRAPCP